MTLRKTLFFLGSLASVLMLAVGAGAQHGAEYLNQRLSQVAARFAVGHQLASPVQTGKLPAKGTKVHSVEVQGGRCYRAVAVGDADVQNLDVVLRIGRGPELSRDDATDNAAVASHCAEANGTLSVEVRAAAGRGEYAFGLYVAPAGGGQAAVASGGTLEGRLDAAAAKNARGYEPYGDIQRGTLGADGSQRFLVPIGRGVCYKFIAVGGEGVQDIDLHAFVGGTRVASDAGRDPVPVASYCAQSDGRAEIRLHMYRGGGEFVYRTYKAMAEGGPVATIPVGGGNDFLSARMREVHAKVGQGRAAAAPLRRGRLQTSKSCTWAENLQGGHCYTIIAVAAPSAQDIDLTLTDPSGNRVADDSEGAQNTRTATTCPPFPGAYRIKVRMTAGYGQIGTQVFGD